MGYGYEPRLVEALMFVGVAVMYLSMMRYSYACELVLGLSTTGDRGA